MSASVQHPEYWEIEKKRKKNEREWNPSTIVSREIFTR